MLGKILGYLFNFIYDQLASMGAEPANFSFLAMTIIISTIIVKLLVLPLQISSTKKMKKTADLQPKVKEIQEKYGYDQQIASQKVMELYRQEGASITGGCLPLLIQFPILIAFLQVCQNPAINAFGEAKYAAMSKAFFWIKDLSLADPYWYGLPLIATLVTLLMSVTTPKVGMTDQQQAKSMNMMQYFMPLMTFFFTVKYPAGLALYWAVSSLFAAIQQFVQNRIIKKEEVIVSEK